MRDKSLSFAAKLFGITNVLEPYPQEFESPYSGKILEAYILRDTCCRPKRLQLILDLERRLNIPHTDTYSSLSIDFMYLRKEQLPQVNRLLSYFFWPSIDSKISLFFPT